MDRKKTILVLAGDGIGPECMNEALRVIDWFDTKLSINFEVSEDYIGGAAYDIYGTCLTKETMRKAGLADAIMFGSVGGPKWGNVAREQRPENGLLQLRKNLDLFANLRPAKVFPALADTSSLKADLVSNLDILIVRELTGGVYFGQPKEIIDLPNGSKQAVDTQLYNSYEIERVARTAFELARKRKGQLCSVEKSNVMETGVLWREIVTQLHASNYQDVKLTHMLADACAMQLVRNPKQFDTIVTDNLFGDMLSDEAAMLTGSIGLLPSASLGEPNQLGSNSALYEPVHGSAPDIAGQGIANPIAEILSLAMMMRYSFNLEKEAKLIEQATSNCLNKGLRTADIAKPGSKFISTKEMGDGILGELDNLVKE